MRNQPKRPNKPVANAIVPISNFPAFNTDDAIPDKTTLEIYRLRREVDALEDLLRIKNWKIDRALEIISGTIHFFRVGLRENQWETYSQLQHRLAKLEGQLKSLLDSANGPPAEHKPIKTQWGNWGIAFTILFPIFTYIQ